ncbi:MAG: hypothetical protein M5R40_24590 [Anaerolineae bacterium]|nr:hypothetical protein [Anaerolineae bacterium]
MTTLVLLSITSVVSISNVSWSASDVMAQSQCDAYVDLGDLQDEVSHNLQGWGGAWYNQPPSPSGDTSFRYQFVRGWASLILCIPQVGIDYVLTIEIQDFGCTDNFQVYVNGNGPLYDYVATPVEAVIAHEVPIPANLILDPVVEITFRNTSTDDCGAAAVYNASISTSPEASGWDAAVRAYTDLDDLIGHPDPRLQGGVLKEFLQSGGISEWGYWNTEYGYTRLGWTWITQDGEIRYVVSEGDVITKAELEFILLDLDLLR